MSFSRELTMPIYVEKGSVVHDTRQAHLYRPGVSKGVMENPLQSLQNRLCKGTNQYE